MFGELSSFSELLKKNKLVVPSDLCFTDLDFDMSLILFLKT